MYSSPFILQVTDSLEGKRFARVVEQILIMITSVNFITHITSPISSSSFRLVLWKNRQNSFWRLLQVPKTSKIYLPQMRKGSCSCLPRIIRDPPPYFPLRFWFPVILACNIQKSTFSATVLNFWIYRSLRKIWWKKRALSPKKCTNA